MLHSSVNYNSMIGGFQKNRLYRKYNVYNRIYLLCYDIYVCFKE